MQRRVRVHGVNPHAERPRRAAHIGHDVRLEVRILDEEHVELVVDVVWHHDFVVELQVLKEVVAVDQGLAALPTKNRDKQINY